MTPKAIAITTAVLVGACVFAFVATLISPHVVGLYARTIGVLGTPALIGSWVGVWMYRSALRRTQHAARDYLLPALTVGLVTLIACGAIQVTGRILDAVFLARGG